MSAQLSEPEAWREIARQVAEGEPMGSGLCLIGYYMWCYGLVDEATWKRMSTRAMRHVGAWNRRRHVRSMYAYPQGEEREARTFAALWMALEAEAGIAP